MRFVFTCLGTLVLYVAILSKTFAGEIEVRAVPAISDRYILPDDRPEQFPDNAALRIVAAPDQYEPASFVVFAERTLPQLQASIGKLRDQQGRELAGAQLDLRVVKRWYQLKFGYGTNSTDPRTRRLVPELLLHDDSLVQLRDGQNYLRLTTGEYINTSKQVRSFRQVTPRPDEFPVRDSDNLQPVTIAAGDNRQFWLTVYVPPGAVPGNYRTEITLRSAQQDVAVVPVELEVLPFELSSPRLEYSIYYRGILDEHWPDGSVSSEYKSAAQMLTDLRNLRAHGITNPAVYQPLSSSSLAQVLDLRRQAGIQNDSIYYLGVDIAPPGDSAHLNKYRNSLARQIEETLDIAADFGIREVYFYARDEARDERLLEQLHSWEFVREQGGRVMAAGWRSDSARPGNFAVTGGNEDLFNSLGMLSRQESAQWHSRGKLIYSYQNPTGGEEYPETWRRNYGLLLWQYDYDGAMPYAWQHSYGDAWNDFDDANYRDHNFTYPTVDGAIDTLQWEGLRAAVDDSRYLATLLDTLESAQGRSSPHAPAAREWLRELKDAPLAQRDLSSLREEMAGHILALRNFPSQGQSGNVWPAANAVPLRLERLTIDPILANGSTEVSWQTNERANSQVVVRDPHGQIFAAFESDALEILHRLRVTGLRPGRVYIVEVSSTTPQGRSAKRSEALDTGVAITPLETGMVRSAGNADITTGVVSNYRASIGIDWQRSLLGWWRFTSGKNAGDDSSDRNTIAVLRSGAAPGAGWFGRGVRLNGAGAFVHASEIDIPKNGRGTIEGWFRFRSFAMDNKANMGIFSGLYQHEANNHFYFNGTNDFFPVASLLTLGAWHHIALSWDGDADSARLYVDGRPLMPVLQNTVEDVASIDGFRIGDNTDFLGALLQRSKGTFDGDVDEVRIWNRVLSPAEIQASYAAGDVRLTAQFPWPSDGKPEWSIIGANAADQVIEQQD